MLSVRLYLSKIQQDIDCGGEGKDVRTRVRRTGQDMTCSATPYMDSDSVTRQLRSDTVRGIAEPWSEEPMAERLIRFLSNLDVSANHAQRRDVLQGAFVRREDSMKLVPRPH